MGAGEESFLPHKHQVCDHLRSVNVCKSTAPNEMHARVLRALTKPLSVLGECQKKNLVVGQSPR